MEASFIHADIFFFITSIVVVIGGILLCIGGFYVLRILKNAAALSDTVRREGDNLAEDFSDLREVYVGEGKKLAYFLQFLTKIIGAKTMYNAARGGSAARRKRRVVTEDSDDGSEEKN